MKRARADPIVMPQGRRAAAGRKVLGLPSYLEPDRRSRRPEGNHASGEVRCGGVREEEMYNTNTTELTSTELRSGNVQDGTGVGLASQLLLSQHKHCGTQMVP